MLFRTGRFILHSGQVTKFKIDCDDLSNDDLRALAPMVVELMGDFGSVEGVARGGLRLAEFLRPYTTEGLLLVVDDVLTTGRSMEVQRAGRDAMGAVIFARAEPPGWVKPLFTMNLEISR